MTTTARRTGWMLLALTTLIFGLTAGVGDTEASAAGKGKAVEPSHRAMWVWTRPPAARLVRWAAKQNVDTLFLQVPAQLSQSPTYKWTRRVVSLARVRGMRIDALNGDLGWLHRPQKALEWQASAEATGLFDGIHIDVEPWSLPEWQSEQERDVLVSRYLNLLDLMGRHTKLPLEADIAYWLHKVPTMSGVPLDAAVMQRVDAVTVMSYRNKATGPDGITTVGATALLTARNFGIPCRLAAETLYYGTDRVSRKQTFHGLSNRQLRRRLERVDRVARPSPSYNGIAVHHYDSWRTLR